MGNDGGSISVRDDLVKVKARAEKADPETVRQGLWTLCALSRKPLRTPVVSDQLGRLYNKEAVVEYLLQKSELPADRAEHAVAGHIRGLKDITELTLTPNPDYRPPSPSRAESDTDAVPFTCPLTSRQMNGAHRFVYLAPCGCVMSESGLRAVAAAPKSNGKRKQEDEADDTLDTYPCPLCGHHFSAPGLSKSDQKNVGEHVVPLNPLPAEQQALRQAMEDARQAARKRKSKKNGTDHKAGSAAEDKSIKAEQKAARQAKIGALTAELAEEHAASPALRPSAGEGDAIPTPQKKRAKAL